MIINRDTRPWVCRRDQTVIEALARIDANRSGVVFVTEADGTLVGVVTDGDLRRSVLRHGGLDAAGSVDTVMNPAPLSMPFGSTPAELDALFDSRIAHIPLLDERGRVRAVATTRGAGVRLGDFTIDAHSPTFFIAEIGINHNGDAAIAMELVDRAAEAGAQAAKFQMRDLASLYRNAGSTFDPNEDLGTQYTLDLLSRFALTNDELFAAFDRCASHGMVPLCTPWDHPSVEALESYGVAGYKIASADLTNHDLVAHVAETGAPVIVSTGMSSEHEIVETVDVLQRHGAAYVLLHCNSTYPAPFHDINLRYMERLGEIGACPVGYSGHERGWHVAVAAVGLGASVIEKHITLDRGMEGNDHKVSLLPTEFTQMVTQVRQLEDALGSASPRALSQGELMNRVTLAKSLVATRTIDRGEVIDAADIAVKSPGRGLQPNRRSELVGRTAVRTVRDGEFFFDSDLTDTPPAPRPYHFRRPWGLPVRYHDLAAILDRAAPDFVEFHLSYQDMDLDPFEFVPGTMECGFTVHSPDLFRGDHILNLASLDDAHRDRSVAELQRVVDLTRGLAARSSSTERPIIIVSMGGFSADAPLPAGDLPKLRERVVDSLTRIDDDGVEIVAQSLPPFPWYLGGQMYCNLFVGADDLVAFSAESGKRLCFDVSHSKLAANHRGESFKEFTDLVAPLSSHLHLVDAAGNDGEGLQVGTGEIDWPVLCRQLDEDAPGVGFIPEIWQGHRNEGEDFWIALDRLEKWL